MKANRIDSYNVKNLQELGITKDSDIRYADLMAYKIHDAYTPSGYNLVFRIEIAINHVDEHGKVVAPHTVTIGPRVEHNVNKSVLSDLGSPELVSTTTLGHGNDKADIGMINTFIDGVLFE